MVMSKSLRPPFDRFRHFANEGGRSLPCAPRKADRRCKLNDQRIAFVFQVEFEPLGQMYDCASRRPAIPSCKGQCGGLEQENSTNLPLDVTGNPNSFDVAADEKRRDRLI